MEAMETLTFAGFLVEVGRRTRGRTAIASEAELRDPLKAIMDRIRYMPAAVEHRLLLRVLRALATPTADESFSAADVAALSLPAAQLLCALVDDLTSGRYRRADIEAALRIHPTSPSSSFGFE